MTNGMRPDPFLAYLRRAICGDKRISCHDLMDAETRQGIGSAIQEHSLRATASGNEISERKGCGSPERTDAKLAALAVKAHRRQLTVCSAAQTQILDA